MRAPVSLEPGIVGRWLARAGTLLDGVRQFVREQRSTRRRMRGVLAVSEDDVLADRIGLGPNRGGRRRGMRVRVHAHAPEIAPEARFHQRPHRRIQRAPGRLERGADSLHGLVPGRSLQEQQPIDRITID